MSRRHLLLGLVLLVLLAAAGPSTALAGPVEDGQKAFEARDFSAAAEAFSKALDANAGNVEAAEALARSVIEGGLSDAYVATEERLHEALAKNPKNRELRLALGDLYLANAKTKLNDQQAMKFIYEDAKATFQALVDEDSKDELAVAGLARTHYETAFFDDALAAIDAYMAKNESRGPAAFWKGQILYLRASDAYRNAGYKLTDEVKTLFAQAKDAYATSTQGQPDHFDAWLQLAYAAQYLGETENAVAAYEKAMDLDPHSDLPLKGIAALYTYLPKEYGPTLERLTKDHPDNASAHWFLGHHHLTNKTWDDALASFAEYEKRAKEPRTAATWVGKAHAGKGDDEQAIAYFRQALKFNPADTVAAGAMDAEIRKQFQAAAAQSPKGALGFVEAYQDLFALAPANPFIRNNVAFVLREAYGPHQGDPMWRPVLDKCAEVYEDASRIADREVAGREASVPFATRYVYAGFLNDTGLMFQFYDANRDLEKAEEYYLRALELTDDGYKDTFMNLARIWAAQARWDELHELALASADAIVDENGQPIPMLREAARKMAAQLEAEGKVER